MGSLVKIGITMQKRRGGLLRKSAALDEKDLSILAAMDKMGGNASAQEIGEELGIPPRTVRYRISVMTERGLLLPSFLETHERRVGLGEKILVVQENAGKGEILEKLIREIPIFYWYVPTHGKQDGYLIHTVYDMNNEAGLEKVIRKLEECNIIRGHQLFDIVDYDSKRVDFSQYEPSGEWTWDWDAWIRKLPDSLKGKGEIPHSMNEDSSIIDCDASDISILRLLKVDPETSMAAMASISGISVAKAREKVQRLRDEGAIRGYRRAYGFIGDLLWLSCFFNIESNVGNILSSLYELPFPGVFLMENHCRYCFRTGFTTTDLKRFMEGFRILRPHLESYSFQFHLPDRVESRYSGVFDLFDKNHNRWKIPVEDYLRIVERHA
ncbi:MAG: winged helix-turn-helix transcriptional regulator [Candidatus Hodarchaeota archaeon]